MLFWKILDPFGVTYQGEITPLTKKDFRALRPILNTEREIDGWFDWQSFVNQHPEYVYYKLERVGSAGILGIIALSYRDGVFVASVETEMYSRHMPRHQKRYVNLADIMLSFASLWGTTNYNDSFIGLIPKDNKIAYYKRKFGARLFGQVYVLDQAILAKMIELYYY